MRVYGADRAVRAARVRTSPTPQRAAPLRVFTVWGVVALVAMAGAVSAMGLPPIAIAVAVGAFVAALVAAAAGLRRGHPHRHLGAANVVTLVRLGIVAFLLCPLLAGGAHPSIVIPLSVFALVLDGVDGHLARRQHLESRFGASFDMEVDSAFALVLSGLAASGPAGPLALVLGIPRYLFGVAGIALPWLNAPLPPRFSRKVVCVVQLVVLIVLQSPTLPVGFALSLTLATIGLVAWSFSVDVRQLFRSRISRTEESP